MPPKKYKKVISKKTIVVQGFNIQGSNNILRNASIENNTTESGTAEEEIIIQGFNLTENSSNNDLEGALAKNNKVISVIYESESDKEDEIKEKITQSKKDEEELERLFKEQRLGLENILKKGKRWKNDHQELQENQIIELESNKSKPTLKDLVGKGGYSEVYYGKWKSQEVAIKKLLLSPHDTSESDLKDIQKEINILKSLRNRYIIQYYDTYSDNQELFIIMDYAENGTLTKFINDNRNKEHDWNFNSKLIQQMTLGLTYIHHEKIIHRDLKSMNILLDNNYQVKISDFGLSKVKDVSLSQSKDIKGTLRWMAPELLKGEKHSEQSDIYSLGMIIWEIAAKCTKPFKDDSDDVKVMLKIFDNWKETIPSDAPQNIQGIIKQCWKDIPSERITLKKILEMIKKDRGESRTFKNPSSFTQELIQNWQTFSPSQTQDWINIGLSASDHSLASWLRDFKKLTPEQVLNHYNLETLRQEFETYQAQIEIAPKF